MAIRILGTGKSPCGRKRYQMMSLQSMLIHLMSGYLKNSIKNRRIAVKETTTSMAVRIC